MKTHLEIGSIRLRPLGESDLQTLYAWRNQTDFLSLFSPRRTVVSYEKFLVEHKRDMERERHLQFIAEITGKNKALGTIYSYNLNLVDGNAFIGGYMPEDTRGLGYGAISCALYLPYLFEFFLLHKVYFEAFGYNKFSLPMLRNFGFVEEGRFKEHRFHDGEYHDLIRMAVYRDDLKKTQSLLARLSKRYSKHNNDR
jgi:diamine N-acetyltransferase